MQNLKWKSDVEGRIGYTLSVRKELTLLVKILLDLISLHALQVVFELSVLVCEVLCDLLELHDFVFPDIKRVYFLGLQELQLTSEFFHLKHGSLLHLAF